MDTNTIGLICFCLMMAFIFLIFISLVYNIWDTIGTVRISKDVAIKRKGMRLPSMLYWHTGYLFQAEFYCRDRTIVVNKELFNALKVGENVKIRYNIGRFTKTPRHVSIL